MEPERYSECLLQLMNSQYFPRIMSSFAVKQINKDTIVSILAAEMDVTLLGFVTEGTSKNDETKAQAEEKVQAEAKAQAEEKARAEAKAQAEEKAQTEGKAKTEAQDKVEAVMNSNVEATSDIEKLSHDMTLPDAAFIESELAELCYEPPNVSVHYQEYFNKFVEKMAAFVDRKFYVVNAGRMNHGKSSMFNALADDKGFFKTASKALIAAVSSILLLVVFFSPPLS